MASTPWIPAVKKISDGEDVDQATVNVTFDQLIQREQHLYEKFDELSGKSVLIAFEQAIHPDELSPNQSINSGHLNVVYYANDDDGEGVVRAITGFSSSNTKSMYAPNNSNYTFGIVKTVSANDTVDLYIEGLCELEVDLDDATYGLIEQDPIPETFQVGPYYLSRKYPGKITKNPSGIPIYVGYAISKRKFILHPNVDEFSQFFINYRYNVLDRPAATPELDAGVWTIDSVENPERLGWLPADEDNLPGYIIPSGAKFFYYIPNDFANEEVEPALTDDEIIEATELKGLLPPVPANFVQLTVNGVLQRYRDVYNEDGIYNIDQFGIWWYEDTDGKQPWASDIGSGSWEPDDWPSEKGSDEQRPRIFISFAKFNPALRTQLVSSLAPFIEDDVDSSGFVKFYSKDNPSLEASTGDLLMKVLAQFATDVGFSAGSFTYPVTATSTYTANRAIAALKYDPETGKFIRVITPVVAAVTGSGDITVTESPSDSGKFTISYQSEGVTGLVDSIEPLNSKLEFKGLHSYLKLPYANPVTVKYGLIGKIVLPKGYPNGQPLSLVLQLFGSTSYIDSATARKVALRFDYDVSTAMNGNATSSIITGNNPISASYDSPVTNPVVFNLTDTGVSYTANQVYKTIDAGLVIPADYIGEDSVVNFRLVRDVDTSDNYPGDLGILSIYWTIAIS